MLDESCFELDGEPYFNTGDLALIDDDGYVRLVVTRGAGTLGLNPNKTSDPQVIIITDDIALYPDEFYEHGLEIVTASTQRINLGAFNPRVKSLNYLNNILATRYIVKKNWKKICFIRHVNLGRVVPVCRPPE